MYNYISFFSFFYANAIFSMDSGKSTLVSVLTHGREGRPHLDNGRGRARSVVFRHKHEMESGRTSSLSLHTLGYGINTSKPLNYTTFSGLTPSEIVSRARKVWCIPF